MINSIPGGTHEIQTERTKGCALAVLLPCFNEEAVLPETLDRLTLLLGNLQTKGKVSPDSYILCIDDGSTDATWEIIENQARTNMLIRGIKLSINRGHQNSLIAGMEYVRNMCDCLISIDADLQQDEQSIELFIDKYAEGSEVVLGVRNDRKTDGWFKRISASLFYWLMNCMGVQIVKNHADYRLLSRRANCALLEFKEANLFLRGLIPLLGFKSSVVYFDVKERFAGTSKYTLPRMAAFALDGITSFSVVPLRVISIMGFVVFLLSAIMGVFIFYAFLFTDRVIPGWASTVVPIYSLGGLQILALGVVGEYIGRIYMETKERPRYFIEKETKNDQRRFPDEFAIGQER